MEVVECCFTSIETTVLLGTGAQDGHLDVHTASELEWRWEEKEIIYLSLHCHHQNDSCIKKDNDDNARALLIFLCFMDSEVPDSVHKQQPF